ncbi:MAG: phosphoglucosamine mutase, partial [Lentisphaeria bacterium]|nr:phosphoglucosamine mutase [Lentisphaeria bacterium]NQZ68391.1 phosphoglucosamine mutase [Lentisphaeria bacterium]
ADDNGIKLFNKEGFKLPFEQQAELEDLILNHDLSSDHIDNSLIGKAHRIEDARGRYIEFSKSAVRGKNLNGLKIILDCANGAAYFLGPLIFKELGAEVISIGVTPDGYNINDGVGALHPQKLADIVLKEKADIGIALDGDSDRIVIVDEKGQTVNGDVLLGVLAKELKANGKLKNDTLVCTVMSNLGMINNMKEAGIDAVITDVGDHNIINEMRRNDYNFGGENSGHIIFMDHVTTGDGIITALQIMKIMLEKEKPLSDIVGTMDLYPSHLENIYIKEKKALEDVEAIQTVLKECEAALGDKGRHLVRYSGTEKMIRILIEAESQSDVDLWIEKISAIAKAELC